MEAAGTIRTGPDFDVAVSIVSYRQPADEIAALLHSVAASERRLHVTVFDNSPDSGLRGVVEAAGAEYIHSTGNVGFGNGHNVAVQRMLGKAKYFAILNPDVSFRGDVLGDLFCFMEKHPDVGQVMPAIRNPDGSEQRLAKRLPSPSDLLLRRFLGPLGARLAPERWARYETRDLDLSVPREIPCLSGCFMFLRGSVLQQVGLFDQRYFLYMEDVDLCRRIGDVSKTVLLPSVAVTHGYHKGSYKNLRLLWLHVRSAVQYFSKWGWFSDPERDARNERTGRVS